MPPRKTAKTLEADDGGNRRQGLLKGSKTVTAGAAAGGVTTLMAGIITLMPKHLEAGKPFLTLLTPILSVAFGGLFLLAQFYFDRMKIDRLFKALIKQTS